MHTHCDKIPSSADRLRGNPAAPYRHVQWLEFLALCAGINPGLTERIALALDHRLIAERIFVIVTTYIDEAGTHGDAPHMIMGALVGRLGQWADFDKKWRKMLRRNGIEYFHSKKLKHSNGPFKGWGRAQKMTLITTASDIQQKTTLFGVSVKLRQSDYDQHYRSGERPKKLPLDTMYGLGFRYLAAFIMDTAEQSLMRKDLEFDFIIESGHKNAGDALRVFKQMKYDLTRSSEMKSLIFRDKKSLYGLQGADLFSHTAYLMERDDDDEMELTELPTGGTLVDARRLVKHKSPLFRGVLGPELLKEIKANKIAYEQQRIEFGRRRQQEIASRAGEAA